MSEERDRAVGTVDDEVGRNGGEVRWLVVTHRSFLLGRASRVGLHLRSSWPTNHAPLAASFCSSLIRVRSALALARVARSEASRTSLNCCNCALPPAARAARDASAVCRSIQARRLPELVLA